MKRDYGKTYPGGTLITGRGVFWHGPEEEFEEVRLEFLDKGYERDPDRQDRPGFVRLRSTSRSSA